MTFDEIYNRYRRSLVAYAQKLHHDRHVAKEIVNDAFLALHKRLEAGEAPEFARSFLVGVIRRISVDRLRQRYGRHADEAKRQFIDSTVQLTDAMECVDRRLPHTELLELQEMLRVSMATLSEDERDAVQLVHVQGYSYAESAEKQSVPLATFKRRMQIAVQKLRLALSVTYFKKGRVKCSEPNPCMTSPSPQLTAMN